MLTEPKADGSAPPGHPPRPAQGLRLRPLPSCEEPFFPVVHEYFEVVYGPLIGPTSLFLARTLARHLAGAGGPVTVCPIQLSLEVGLRSSHTEPLGKGSHLAKAIERLGHHRLVRPLGTDILGVVTAVPPVADKLLARLPESTRTRHEHHVARLTSGPSDRPDLEAHASQHL